MSVIRYNGTDIEIDVAESRANVVCGRGAGMSLSVEGLMIEGGNLYADEDIDFGAISAESNAVSVGNDGAISAAGMPLTLENTEFNITRNGTAHTLRLKEAYADASYEPSVETELYSQDAVATLACRIVMFEDFDLDEETHKEVEMLISGRTELSQESSDVVVGDGQFAFTYCAEPADESRCVVFTPPVGDESEARRRAGIHISNFVQLKGGDTFTFTDVVPAKWTDVYNTTELWDGSNSTPVFLLCKEIPPYTEGGYVADSDTGSISNVLTESVEWLLEDNQVTGSFVASEDCYMCIIAVGHNYESFENLTYSIEAGVLPEHTYPASIYEIGEVTQEDIDRYGYEPFICAVTGASRNYGSGVDTITGKENGMGFGTKILSGYLSILIPNMSVGYTDGLYFDLDRVELTDIAISAEGFRKEIIYAEHSGYFVGRDGENLFEINRIVLDGVLVVDSNPSITITIYFDNNSRSVTLSTTIH